MKEKLSGLKIFNKLSVYGRLLVFTFWPSELEEFLEVVSQKYDLVFHRRGRLESCYRRRFPVRGKPAVEVEVCFLPDRIKPPERGIKVVVAPTFIPVRKIPLFRELIVLFPYSFDFSCSLFGNPCSSPELAINTVWEGGICYKNCYGLWELFFGKNWCYYGKDLSRCSFRKFSLNGRKLKRAEKIYGLLKEAVSRSRVLKLFSAEEILLIPLGNNLALKLMEMDENPVVADFVQAALDVEATFLGHSFSHEFVTYRSILNWKEEKNAYLPESVISHLRSRSFL